MIEKHYCYCPECKSLFKLDRTRLDFSDGLVRCGKCQEIFNSTETLLEKTDNGFVPILTQNVSEGEYAHEAAELEQQTRRQQETDETETVLNDANDVSIDDEYLDDEVDDYYFAIDDNDESEESGDIETFSQNILLDERAQKEQLSGSVNFGSLNNHAEELIRDKTHPLQTFFWALLLVILVSVFVLQIKLFVVEKYAHDIRYRDYLSVFCRVVQCTLPARSDSSLISITSTQINQHPNQPNGIRVSVKLVNEADFAQPFPPLQLTLTDSSGRVVGRRTFGESEYLAANAKKLLNPHQLSEAYIDLAQPHEKAVGFSVDIVGAHSSH